MLTVILTSLLVALPLCFSAPDPRIVGGIRVTNRTQFAYQVSLQRSGSHRCGGSIIDSKHVLTAAHCCVEGSNGKAIPSSQLRVVVGNLKLYGDPIYIEKYISKVYVHERYDPDLVSNDICVLRISGSFDWSPNVRSIALQNETITGGYCNVSGWGVTKYGSKAPSTDLLYVSIPIVPFKTCNARYGNGLGGMKVICAGEVNKDSCQGDSGGPLTCGGLLTGIVSFGRGCGSEYPGVYTHVSSYRDWIERKVNGSASIRSLSMILLVIVMGNMYMWY